MYKWSLTSLVLVVVWAVLATTAGAQQRSVSDQLTELGKAVDELRDKTVQIPTLAEAVQDLSTRLAELERALAETQRSQVSIPDAIARLDALRDRVDMLEREAQGLRTQLASVEQGAGKTAGGAGVVYKDKFSWATDDESFAIAISGYLHARYQLDTNDGDLETSSLRVRRARIGVGGHLGSSKLAYKLVISAVRDKPLLDYIVDYKHSDSLVLRFGQYKTPFTREFITSSTRRTFLESPLAVELLRYDRDVQLGVHGELLDNKRVAYYAGVGNGAGLNRDNDNLDMDVVLRVDAVALGERFKYAHGDLARSATPTLMIGAGFIHDLTPMPQTVGAIAVNSDVDGDGEVDNVRALSTSADLAFRYRGVEAVFEAVVRQESYGTILEHTDNADLVAALGRGDDHTYLDLMGQLTYVLPIDIRRAHRLLVGGRAGRSEVPFLGVGGRSSKLPRGAHVLEADALVQLYSPRGYRLLGLMYSVHDYSAIDGVAGTGGTVHRVIVESQLKF